MGGSKGQSVLYFPYSSKGAVRKIKAQLTRIPYDTKFWREKFWQIWQITSDLPRFSCPKFSPLIS